MKYKDSFVRAKKSLGQHFLNDETIAKDIVDALYPFERFKHVIEVGPGMGVLTKYLLEKNFPLTLVEIDKEAVQYLNEHYPSLNPSIIEEDFLQLSLSTFEPPFAIIGNFPYNISSQILFRVLEEKDNVSLVVGMFQKEVAKRIASPPGNKDYGILSVLLQAWYDIEYLFSVEESKFNPPPKVKSGVIRLVRNKRTRLGCDEQLFKKIVKQAFNQRRKTIRNSLNGLYIKSGKEQLPYAEKRPEQLSWQQFVELSNFIEVQSKS